MNKNRKTRNKLTMLPKKGNGIGNKNNTTNGDRRIFGIRNMNLLPEFIMHIKIKSNSNVLMQC